MTWSMCALASPSNGRTPGQRASRERRRIPRTFVQWAVEHVPDRPVQALVDESNLAARLMYGELGWDVAGKVHVGWPEPQLVYRTPMDPHEDR